MSDLSFQRVHALLHLGRAADAERGFRELLATDPENGDLLLGLARALLLLRRPSEAADLARAALAADPEDVDALVVLVAAAQASGDTLQAMIAALDAVRLAPGHPLPHHHHATTLFAVGRHREALEALDRTSALDPHDAQAQVLRAQVLVAMDRHLAAEEAVRAALRLDPEHVGALQVLAVLQLADPQEWNALDTTRAALQAAPDEVASRELHAVALKSLNPLFRALYRRSQAETSRPTVASVVVVLVLFLLAQLLRSVLDEAAARALVWILLGLFALVLGLNPLMNLVLMTSRTGRGLLSPVTRRATLAFAGGLVATVGAVVMAVRNQGGEWIVVAASTAVWGIAVGSLGSLRPDRVRGAVWVHAVAAVLNVLAAALVLLGLWIGPFGLALVLAGSCMLLFTRLA